MTSFRPIRIRAALKNRHEVLSLIERHAPYRAIAAYGPEGIPEPTDEKVQSALPFFRGNWAVCGKPLVDGAQEILENQQFLDAAKALFGTSSICPQNIFINVNAPMPAGEPHIDVATFRGAQRDRYPLPFLKVMGKSGLFERWRVLQAGALSWFYNGVGGEFDYWPDGRDGPMSSERSPFGDTSLVIDSDRMYHRIGGIGDPNAELPRMSANAEIHSCGDGTWSIVENGEVRATYPRDELRFSVLWKAEVHDAEMPSDELTLDRIMQIFVTDLHHRRIDCRIPADPPSDTEFTLLLQRCYSAS